jgi:CelD/BcsL family acetyltransferase involved in cellulose biosynthesis
VAVEISYGAVDVAAAIDGCHQLMKELDAPLSAQGTWLTAALRCLPSTRPAAIVSRSATGATDGAAFLNVVRSRGWADVTLLGAHVSDHARLLAADADAARRVADGILSVLADLRGPWRLHIEQAPYGDPVLAHLATSLRHSVLAEGDVCPVTRFGPDRSLAAHLSKNGRGTVKKARNRLTREDPEWRIERTRDLDVITALLPTVVDIHRTRDRAMRRRSDFDDPRRVDFYAAVMRELAAGGSIELATLLVNGAIAAYVVVLVDGGVWRFFDGRVSVAHAHLNAGRVVDIGMLSAALEDPFVVAVDWGRGDLEYKRQSANDAIRTETLTAWSSAGLRNAERSARWGRDQVRAAARIRLPQRSRGGVRGDGARPSAAASVEATR